jgi:hypothetical protein
VSLGPVQIVTRQDALVWQLVDAVFSGGDAIELCRQFELDLYREKAEAVLEHERLQGLLGILRDTDPAREAAVA